MQNKGTIKSRLILNRVPQQRIPLKINEQFRSRLRVDVRSPMNDVKNIIENKNSSIKGQESLQKLQKLPLHTEEIMQCRSISCTDSAFKARGRLWRPSLHKNVVLEDKPTAKQNLQYNFIQNFSHQFVSSLRDRSELRIRNSMFHTPINAMLSIFTQYGRKLLSININSNNSQKMSQQAFQDCRSCDSSIKMQRVKVLTLQKVCSLKLVSNRLKILSNNNQIIDIQLNYEQVKNPKQGLQKTMACIQSFNQQQFINLLNKVNGLKQQIALKEANLSKLIQQQQQKHDEIISQQVLIATYEDQITQHKQIMKTIEDSQKQIDSFLMAQPNKILLQEVQGYKQQEQQLFELACMLEDSLPQQVSSWMAQIIIVPQQSFQLTLECFPIRGLPEKDFYQISIDNMQKFKKSVKTCLDTIISKFRSILQTKCKRVRQFVGTMRRLASYTIGKREYLSDINNKMATVSTVTEKLFSRFEGQMCNSVIKEISIPTKDFIQLHDLSHRMKQIYNEAQVFF